jgi:tyrosyl-tRNA synthetase
MMPRLQQAGHRPVVLMGGGTTKIEDPSGKDEAPAFNHDEIRPTLPDPQGVRALPDLGDGPATRPHDNADG